MVWPPNGKYCVEGDKKTFKIVLERSSTTSYNACTSVNIKYVL